MEVAIAQARDLREEGHAEARLETAPHAHHAARRGELEGEHRDEENVKRTTTPRRALLDGPELAPDVEETAHEEGLDRGADGRCRRAPGRSTRA